MNQTNYLGTIGYITGLYQAGGGQFNSIDPLEYSTGLFINVDCKLANALELRDSRNIQNLSGNSYNYFQTNNGNLTNMVTENGFIFNGTNGWYNVAESSSKDVQLCNVKTFTSEIVFSTNSETTGHLIANVASGGFNIAFLANGAIQANVYVENSGYVPITSPENTVERNKINYVAITYDQKKLKLYINPESKEPQYTLEINKPLINFSNAPIALGYNPSSTGTSEGSEFIGKIYSGKVWAIAKSDDFIFQSYKYQKNRFNF